MDALKYSFALAVAFLAEACLMPLIRGPFDQNRIERLRIPKQSGIRRLLRFKEDKNNPLLYVKVIPFIIYLLLSFLCLTTGFFCLLIPQIMPVIEIPILAIGVFFIVVGAIYAGIWQFL